MQLTLFTITTKKPHWIEA